MEGKIETVLSHLDWLNTRLLKLQFGCLLIEIGKQTGISYFVFESRNYT